MIDSLSLPLSLQDEKMNVEALSRAELLTLLSILEGELEAQDVVIHALRVSWPVIHRNLPMDSCVIHIAGHLTSIIIPEK